MSRTSTPRSMPSLAISMLLTPRFASLRFSHASIAAVVGCCQRAAHTHLAARHPPTCPDIIGNLGEGGRDAAGEGSHQARRGSEGLSVARVSLCGHSASYPTARAPHVEQHAKD